RACLGDVTKHRLFLLRIASYRFDKIGNQVGAALQHNVHLRPGRLDRFILGHQSVADTYVLPKHDQHNQHQNNEYNHALAHTFLLESSVRISHSLFGGIQQCIDGCSYLLHRGQVSTGYIVYIKAFVVDLLFTDVQQLQESRRVQLNQRGQRLNSFPFRLGSRIAHGDQRVAEQSQKCRERTQQQLPQAILTAPGQQHTLAKENRLLAQLILQLHAMETHGNRQALKNILPVENAVLLPHVQKFD